MSFKTLELVEATKADRKTKIGLYLLFIEEYGGLMQHLNNIGLKWGADGAEVRANKRAVELRNHINAIQARVMELATSDGRQGDLFRN